MRNTPTMHKNTHKHTNTSLPALYLLYNLAYGILNVCSRLNGNAKKEWQKFLLTKLIRRWQKNLQAVKI